MLKIVINDKNKSVKPSDKIKNLNIKPDLIQINKGSGAGGKNTTLNGGAFEKIYCY